VKFFGIEDIATFEAFNVLGVFMSGNNSNPRVFAGGNHRFVWAWIWKLLPQIVASFSIISNGILVNLRLGEEGGEVGAYAGPPSTPSLEGKSPFSMGYGIPILQSLPNEDFRHRVFSSMDLRRFLSLYGFAVSRARWTSEELNRCGDRG
jgi:hypothetical protein